MRVENEIGFGLNRKIQQANWCTIQSWSEEGFRLQHALAEKDILFGGCNWQCCPERGWHQEVFVLWTCVKTSSQRKNGNSSFCNAHRFSKSSVRTKLDSSVYVRWRESHSLIIVTFVSLNSLYISVMNLGCS